MTTEPVTDPCQSCGISTSPGSGRFVNRIPASGDVELPDGSTEYQHGWGCALCYEPCGFEDEKGYICHGCNPEGLEDEETGPWPVYAHGFDYSVACQHCGDVLHDWDGIERGTA